MPLIWKPYHLFTLLTNQSQLYNKYLYNGQVVTHPTNLHNSEKIFVDNAWILIGLR